MYIVDPIYSHGGPDVVNWPAVPGNAAGPGRPICTFDTTVPFCFCIFAKSTTEDLGACVTVSIEASGAAIDPTTKAPFDEWINAATRCPDETNILQCGQGWTLRHGECLWKKIRPEMPYWRTMILDVTGNIEIVSYIPTLFHWEAGRRHIIRGHYPSVPDEVSSLPGVI